jgi:hypothetical protein
MGAGIERPGLAGNALTFKGNLARMTGRVGAMIGMSQAAQRHQGVYIGQLAFAATQEACGHSMIGDHARADRMLAVADHRANEIPRQAGAAPPWNYDTPALIALERGLIQHQLGRYQVTADLIAAALADLPAEQRDAEWTEQYRCTLTEARAEL